ncbi:MAG TPA: hypothetical protein VG456_14150 [Candidatus Sulfopaludibacter sp.]|nr:hypothetical protein [Candidatus Sulfopaludibacter sp.]
MLGMWGVLAVAATQLQGQTILGKNLVVNGDAESGTATSGGNTPPASIPGWTPTGTPNVIAYSADDRLGIKSIGPANRGNNYFAGTNTAKGVLTQKIDVSTVGTSIDKGTISFDVSAYLGGGDGDNSSLTVTFLNAGGTSAGTVTLGPLLDADRANSTGLYMRRQLGAVPSGTRSISVEVDLLRTSGINNFGCADNISLILNDDSQTPASFYGTNLIANANGETPNGTQLPVPLTSVLSTGIVEVPNWVLIGAFTEDTYSNDSDLNVTDPSPSDRGSWYFYGGGDSVTSSATQDIDVAGAASQIDAGKVAFAFSAWVGGYSDQDDNMVVSAQFLNWQGGVLGGASLGPVLAADRNQKSALQQKSQTGTVPAGTRMIRIKMLAVRHSGIDDDGLADSLSMVLTVPGTSGTAPAIQSGGVVSASAFGGFTAIGPGTWIEIYGSNLAGSSREWAGADFNGTTAPIKLDGTTVQIAGQNAFIRFISPGQVNAQVPTNISPGSQQLTVTTLNGTSAAYPITVNATQAGLLAPSSFIVGGKQYVVALHTDGTFVLPPNSIAGLSTKQAQPGETILLYGIGFGSVTPSIGAGQIVGVANQIAAPLQMQIGQAAATLVYDGLAPNFVGLYQFNVTVPNLSDNDLTPLTFNLGGTAGSQSLYLAVKK